MRALAGRPPSKHTDNATLILTELQSTMTSYHNHKEDMAYSGFVVYIGLMGAILTSGTWPLKILPGLFVDKGIGILVLLAIFALCFSFIRWQLENRRVAAIRTTALQNVLFKWAASPPNKKDLLPFPEPEKKYDERVGRWHRFLHMLWPEKTIVIQIDVVEQSMPTCLAQECNRLRDSGENGLTQERLLVGIGWLLLLILIGRTLLFPTP